MKTFKYKGKEYQVIDVWFIDGSNVDTLHILAVIKDGGLDVLEFTADHFKKRGEVVTRFEQQYTTKRTIALLHQC